MTDVKSRLTTVQWVIERNLAWIAAADVKAAVVVTLNVALLGGLATAFSGFREKSLLVYSVSATAIVLSVASLVFVKFAVMPRLEGPPQSLLYFGRIAQMDRVDYVDRVSSSSDEALLQDWARQAHRNAEIAGIKHKWVRRALVALLSSGIPWLLAIYLMAVVK
jgi:Pycsar effector protein